MPEETSRATADALRGFDSPTVMNVLEKVDVQDRTTGYADMSLRYLFPERPPLIGYAFTTIADTTTPADPRPID